MRNDWQKKDQSVSAINNNEDEVSIRQQQTSSKSKTTLKVQSNKHFNCIHIHKNTIYLGSRSSKLYVYNIQMKVGMILKEQDENEDAFELKLVKVITLPTEVISSVKANHKYFVTVPQTDDDSFISIWSAQTFQFLKTFKGHKSQISAIVFSKKQKHLITACWDCTVQIWDIEERQDKNYPVKIFKGNYPILDVKQFNDEVLIIGGDDCYIVFWNWKLNQIIKREFGHAGSVTKIEIFDQLILTAGGDNKFKFWEVELQKSTDTESQDHPDHHRDHDFKPKCLIKKVQQYKQEYDSIVFATFYKNLIILMDRQGELFLFTKSMAMASLSNFFQYNQSITGIDIFEDYLFVTTTKGYLKHIDIKKEIEKNLPNIWSEKIIQSKTQIVNVVGNQQGHEEHQ